MFKYFLNLHGGMSKIAIIENSDGLAKFFTKFLDEKEYKIFPVWKNSQLPKEKFDSYIITGDYNNIHDGLLPIHREEIEFIRSINNKKIFASCFCHQLIGLIFGGTVGKREKRFFGWHKMIIEKEHQIFNGLNEPYFLNLNIDEIIIKPNDAQILANNPDCTFQVLQYGENILTCQSHPEILQQEALESIKEHREALIEYCPDFDKIVMQTKDLADDKLNELFMSNIIAWLRS